MNTTLGLLLILIGAVSSGSFAVPFDGVKGWKWENYWLVTGLFSFIVVPFLACLFLVKDFGLLLTNVPPELFFKIFILGALYGVGSLTFGLSMRYLGLSLGYALSLGLMAAIGTLVPPALDGRFGLLLNSFNGNMVLTGIGISLLGIAGIAYAGYKKDQFQVKAADSEFDFKKGVIAAIITGFLASAMSLGMEQGSEVNVMAEKMGTDPLFSSNPTMFIMLIGTFITTLIWCTYLMIKGNTVKDFVKQKPSVILINTGLTFVAGLLWYLQFIFFGMGKSRMGEYTFAAWGILMAFIIVTAMVWGLFKGEWKGIPSKIRTIMLISLGVIILGTFIIGVFNS